MWFQEPDAFTLVQFHLECGPDHLLKWFERSIYIRLKCVLEGIYTWSFQDRIAIQSEKTHEVTRRKQPQSHQRSVDSEAEFQRFTGININTKTAGATWNQFPWPSSCIQDSHHKYNAKCQMEWCKAHQHWTLEQWKPVLWGDESRFSV